MVWRVLVLLHFYGKCDLNRRSDISSTWRNSSTIITLIFIITKSTRCSIVNDSLSEEATRMPEDCPKQKYCKKGTHVECMYYDRNQLFGPRCENLVKVEVTPNIKHHILANVNYLRGKVAIGRERGIDDEFLPTAYGLMKLEWSNKLAFSAQVLANQCLGDTEDECRATDRFPNPSQTIAIIPYEYPNWEYLPSSYDKKGLDEMKLIFSVDKFLKASQKSKRNVSKDIITNCPPLHELVDVNLKHYLNLINGGTTHIGCGVSAYSSKINDTESIESKQNNVQIVCNFSETPKLNQTVYNTVPPIPGHGYSERCGCPKGYKETKSCLCEIQSKNLRKGLQPKNQRKAGLNQDSRGNIKNRSHDEEVVSSEKKDQETNDGQPRHFISNSRNIIKFRRNLTKHLNRRYLEENLNRRNFGNYSRVQVGKVENVTFVAVTDAPMVSNYIQEQKDIARARGRGSGGSGGSGGSRGYRGSGHHGHHGHNYVGGGSAADYGDYGGHYYGDDYLYTYHTTRRPPRVTLLSRIIAKLKQCFG